MGKPTHFVAVKLAHHQTVQDAITQVCVRVCMLALLELCVL
jgi:hypothetical protein